MFSKANYTYTYMYSVLYAGLSIEFILVNLLYIQVLYFDPIYERQHIIHDCTTNILRCTHTFIYYHNHRSNPFYNE